MGIIQVFVGGHARQNNGDSGIAIGFYSDPNNMPFYEEAEYVGVETQNSSVYRAIIKALEQARAWKLENIIVHTDNRLVAGQLGKKMTARSQNIIPLHDKVQELTGSFETCEIKYLNGRENTRAKEMARAAAMASPDTITAQAIQFDVGPGITGLVMAFTPKLMMVQFKYKKGSKIAPHQHFHEQSSYIVKGTLKYVVAEQDIVMKRGAGLVVSGNAVHQNEALEDTVEIVTYVPMRADLLKIS